MLMTTRVLSLCNAAKTLARDEFEKGLVLKRSCRADSVANRLVRRIESDYVPGLFGPFLKDENGKCAGCGEWTAEMKRVICDAYLDERAVLIAKSPVQSETLAHYAAFVNDEALKRVREKANEF